MPAKHHNVRRQRRPGNPKCHYHLRLIRRLIKSRRTLVFLHDCGTKDKDFREAGYAEPGIRQCIVIDPSGDIIPTAIHESLHLIFPDEEDDAEIIRLEQSIFSNLSERQIINLLNILVSAINRSRRWKHLISEDSD